ncbi:Zn-ribbon domain-containing OB-fold protein [Caldiplasma sukawensis]
MGELSRIWRETENRYRLTGRKCGNCERIFFPPRDVCPFCHRESLGRMEPVELSGEGTIVSFTVVHEVSPAFIRQRPYVLALIKSVEGPVILGQIVDCDEKDLKIGRKVKKVFRKLGQDGSSGIIHYGYKFIIVD